MHAWSMHAQAAWDCMKSSLLLPIAYASLIAIPDKLSLMMLAAGVMGLRVSLDKIGSHVNQLQRQPAGRHQKAKLHRQFMTACKRHKNTQQCRQLPQIVQITRPFLTKA
ncbi:TPA: hypothetical protein ACH3X2_003138 [Trebouxia sp. C0005]